MKRTDMLKLLTKEKVVINWQKLNTRPIPFLYTISFSRIFYNKLRGVYYIAEMSYNCATSSKIYSSTDLSVWEDDTRMLATKAVNFIENLDTFFGMHTISFDSPSRYTIYRASNKTFTQISQFEVNYAGTTSSGCMAICQLSANKLIGFFHLPAASGIARYQAKSVNSGETWTVEANPIYSNSKRVKTCYLKGVGTLIYDGSKVTFIDDNFTANVHDTKIDNVISNINSAFCDTGNIIYGINNGQICSSHDGINFSYITDKKHNIDNFKIDVLDYRHLLIYSSSDLKLYIFDLSTKKFRIIRLQNNARIYKCLGSIDNYIYFTQSSDGYIYRFSIADLNLT